MRPMSWRSWLVRGPRKIDRLKAVGVILALSVAPMLLAGCDPVAGVTLVNKTDKTVLIYFSDASNYRGTAVQPHSTKVTGIAKQVWKDVIVVRNEERELLFRQRIT